MHNLLIKLDSRGSTKTNAAVMGKKNMVMTTLIQAHEKIRLPTIHIHKTSQNQKTFEVLSPDKQEILGRERKKILKKHANQFSYPRLHELSGLPSPRWVVGISFRQWDDRAMTLKRKGKGGATNAERPNWDTFLFWKKRSLDQWHYFVFAH